MKNPISFSNVVLGNEQQLGVNARDVHSALEVKSDFSHWINRRIKQCKFEEGYDFIKLVKKNERENQGLSNWQEAVEYIISLDMAKHLGMMERNEKGHEMRKYFIEQEKIARNASQSLQVEIGKAMQQIEQITKSLSEAGRFLSIVGKQTKPAMLKELDGMMHKIQPCLNFDA